MKPHAANNTLTDTSICAWLREREISAACRGKREEAMYCREAARAIEHYREAYARKVDEVAELLGRVKR